MCKPAFTVAYSTVFWNHYQGALCRELAHQLGPNRFKMCVMEPLDKERCDLKWAEIPANCDWIIPPPTNLVELDRISQIMCKADVAVMGNLPVEQPWYNHRKLNNKLTFRAAERSCKKPAWHCLLNPRGLRWAWKYRMRTSYKSLHHLAIGAYAGRDARLFGAYGDRQWVWAYFTDIKDTPPETRGKKKLRILWAGRLVNWKRIDMLLAASKRLRDAGVLEQLDIVGTGPELHRLRQLAAKLAVDDVCQFHGSVTPEEVHEYMRRSDLYALPSTRAEGWGVVANEAMSEGCILIANKQAGSAPMLIRNGETGFMHENGNLHQFTKIVEHLALDPALQDRIRIEAWRRMHCLWNPRGAAQRLIELSGGLLGVSAMPNYAEGPCSKA